MTQIIILDTVAEVNQWLANHFDYQIVDIKPIGNVQIMIIYKV